MTTWHPCRWVGYLYCLNAGFSTGTTSALENVFLVVDRHDDITLAQSIPVLLLKRRCPPPPFRSCLGFSLQHHHTLPHAGDLYPTYCTHNIYHIIYVVQRKVDDISVPRRPLSRYRSCPSVTIRPPSAKKCRVRKCVVDQGEYAHTILRIWGGRYDA